MPASAPAVLVAGRGLVEAPRWGDDRLWFSDWDAGEVLRLDPARPDAAPEVVARVESFPLCSALAPDGRLVVVDSPRARLLRRERDGTLTPWADLSGVDVPGWNDVVVDVHGRAYVDGGSFDGQSGVVALVTPDGAVRQVADGFAFPNGLAVTPDGRTLLVADSWAQEVVAFGVEDDGTLSGRRTWASVPEHPDGICLDAQGALWFADVGTARCVRVAEGGQVLDEVETDRGCFACVLGGPDRRTLFVTAAVWRGFDDGVAPGSGRVLAVDVEVPGAGAP